MKKETDAQCSKKGLDRRSFIRETAAGVAAVSLAGAGACRTAPQEQASPPVDPSTAQETWNEPWVWRPDDFPGSRLQLNVVEHQNPSVVVGFGNPGAALFTYNGSTPGPTVRMKGRETLKIRLINHLGLNAGSSPIGPAPDLAAYLAVQPGYPQGVTVLPDWCLGEHTNGIHTAHTTNLHTHGLHVSPQNPKLRPGQDACKNNPGPYSDNIFLRLIPPADLKMREEMSESEFREKCKLLQRGAETDFRLECELTGGQADWDFTIGGVPEVPVHPPGTHWYHPHPHGSTHNEVASGMAGFLIVEGDVDEAINLMLAGKKDADPTVKTGDYDYRERLMLFQRVNPAIASSDPDSLSRKLKASPIPAVNGNPVPPVIGMRPGAIERWRVLNGSVDGKGYLRYMVLKGQWVCEVPPDCQGVDQARTLQDLIQCTKQLLRVEADGTRTVPTTEEIEAAKADLFQLAQDGVTLVRGTPEDCQYTIKPLKNPDSEPYPLKQDFTNLGDCYKNARNLRACYNGSNEVYMAPANRIDVLFQAPQLSQGQEAQVYTVLGKATAIHTENLQRELQIAQEDVQAGEPTKLGFPPDTVAAYVVVRGSRAPGNETLADLLPRLIDALPPVPDYLKPISPQEVQVNADQPQDGYRSRRIVYSGWGAATWPRFEPEQLTACDPDGPRPSPDDINPVYLYDPQVDCSEAEPGVLVTPPVVKTMAINGRKFDPNDRTTPRMELGKPEEWVVYNNSISLFGEYKDSWRLSAAEAAEKVCDSICQGDRKPISRGCLRNYDRDHTVGYPVTRSEADRRGWFISTRGIDHPFHIHINPFWLMRLEVPDQDGNLVNVLDEPRWQDTIWLPRNGGRAVFRSRFPDYFGKYVNHCHILLHEDNGMMQMVEVVVDPKDANYTVSNEILDEDGSLPDAPPDVFHRDSLEEAFKQCTNFVDPNTDPDRQQQYPAPNGCFPPPVPPEEEDSAS